MAAQPPDYGEVQYPGWIGRLRGRLPRIIREANFAAALESLPPRTTVVSTDPNGNWILFEGADGKKQIRFCASEAWLPNEPTLTSNETKRTGAFIASDERLVVVEGMHRTRATARQKVLIIPQEGGAIGVPGWLDFAYDPEALQDTPSSRAICQMLGGDPDGPLVSAR